MQLCLCVSGVRKNAGGLRKLQWTLGLLKKDTGRGEVVGGIVILEWQTTWC